MAILQPGLFELFTFHSDFNSAIACMILTLRLISISTSIHTIFFLVGGMI